MNEIQAPPAADAARLLRLAAEGRREYAVNANDADRLVLEHEAVMLESAARIVEGDLGPLYGLLPSWRWTDHMNARLAEEGLQP